LPVPLPSWTLNDLKSVQLYEGRISPPCVKVRAILKFFKVAFESKEGKPPNTVYKGIPILVVNGRQINDSYIIIKTLAPILIGRAMTNEELEFEKMLTFCLMPALESAVAASCNDLCKCACFAGGGFCCLLSVLSCCIPCCGPARIATDYPNLKSVDNYVSIIVTTLGSTDYLFGDSIGISDVALYGLLCGFKLAGTEVCENMFHKNPTLQKWYDRVAPQVPHLF